MKSPPIQWNIRFTALPKWCITKVCCGGAWCVVRPVVDLRITSVVPQRRPPAQGLCTQARSRPPMWFSVSTDLRAPVMNAINWIGPPHIAHSNEKASQMRVMK